MPQKIKIALRKINDFNVSNQHYENQVQNQSWFKSDQDCELDKNCSSSLK